MKTISSAVRAGLGNPICPIQCADRGEQLKCYLSIYRNCEMYKEMRANVCQGLALEHNLTEERLLNARRSGL